MILPGVEQILAACFTEIRKKVSTVRCSIFRQVAQRAAQLQEALLHCGRFQDALESLLSWLIDTEELVANQKPPSAEFKVVKAQIQEQKVSKIRSEYFSFHWSNENKFPVFVKAWNLFRCTKVAKTAIHLVLQSLPRAERKARLLGA